MTTPLFQLRFPIDQVQHWASRYAIDDDSQVEHEIAPRMRAAGFLTQPDFLALCRWKTRRSKRLCERNTPEFIRAVTQVALSTPDERLRIEVLTLLQGVQWPTASVILHYGYDNLYPILDFRALWSLSVEVPQSYTYDFWQQYTQHCRELAGRAGVRMRTLDRALWQYSQEHQ